MLSNLHSALVSGILMMVIGVGILFLAAAYLCQSIAMFLLFRKAGTKHAWLAFVPIGMMWPFLWSIRKSAWNLLWVVIPSFVAGVLAAVLLANHNPQSSLSILPWTINLVSAGALTWWYSIFFRAFRFSPFWALLIVGSAIPLVNFPSAIALLVLICYMGFNKSIKFDPSFD